jgi:hypothetical protein
VSDFYAGLCDTHLKTMEYMQAELTRVRRENAALHRVIDSMPSTLTELQDRVTMLEGMLK